MRQLPLAILWKTLVRDLPRFSVAGTRNNAHTNTRRCSVRNTMAFVFFCRLRVFDRSAAEFFGGGEAGLGRAGHKDSWKQVFPEKGHELEFVHLVIITFVAHWGC